MEFPYFLFNILTPKILFTSETTTEENLPDKTHKETIPIQESCGNENPTNDSSAQGDPGGKTAEEQTTNDKGNNSQL